MPSKDNQFFAQITFARVKHLWCFVKTHSRKSKNNSDALGHPIAFNIPPPVYPSATIPPFPRNFPSFSSILPLYPFPSVFLHSLLCSSSPPLSKYFPPSLCFFSCVDQIFSFSYFQISETLLELCFDWKDIEERFIRDDCLASQKEQAALPGLVKIVKP